MKAMLQQLDITLNQCYVPFYSIEDKYSHDCIDNLYERIYKRINQIEVLRRLLNDNLSDIDFYVLASKAYWFNYNNKSFIRTNIILPTYNDYLMLNLRINSDIEVDSNKNYSFDEIINLFKKERIILDGIFISEDNDISNIEGFKVCSDSEFSSYYNKMFELYNIVSLNNIRDVKSILTKDKIKKDLDGLIKWTESELGYISRRYNSDGVMLL